MKDKIILPDNLPVGEYVLSWRWDCYMADQIWSNCADVEITDSAIETTTPVSTTSSSGCIDGELPTEWSQAGRFDCNYFRDRGVFRSNPLAYCAHAAIRNTCCFCESALKQKHRALRRGHAEHLNQDALALIQNATVQSSSGCIDGELPTEWSQAGRVDCNYFRDRGVFRSNPLAYCAHAAIRNTCCFCESALKQKHSALRRGHAEHLNQDALALIQNATVQSSSGCIDGELPTEWSQAGRVDCNYFRDRGVFRSNPLAYCAHAAIRNTCCFCESALKQKHSALRRGHAEHLNQDALALIQNATVQKSDPSEL